MDPRTALTIAGSDSGGGAGIQADLRTFSAFEVHGTSAITAVTAQNTLAVTGLYHVEPWLVRAQVEAVVDDFDVRAVKTGMLGQPSTVHEVAAMAREGLFTNLVVDPVLVSSTGHSLMSDGGVEAYRDDLLAHATVVTPNLREAAVLADLDVHDIRTEDDMVNIARIILKYGPAFVLVKGGHFAQSTLTERRSPDILVGASDVTVFDAPRVSTSNDHGTGCSLSAAIAAGLGYERSVADASRDAKSFVLAALQGAANWHLGAGHGPIDHLGWGS